MDLGLGVGLWWSFISQRLGVKYCFHWVKWWHGRRQFGRSGFASTPARGSAVGPSARVCTWGFAPGWYRSGRWPSFLGLGLVVGLEFVGLVKV
jgi:hypothetical protein